MQNTKITLAILANEKEKFDESFTFFSESEKQKFITELELKSEALHSKILNQIYGEVFRNNVGVIRVVLPEGLTIIDERAFEGCTMLEEVVIPPTVQVIKKESFLNCINLKTIFMPNSLREIETHSFKNCVNLQQITIPLTVSKIGKDVFVNCNNNLKINVVANQTLSEWEYGWNAKDYYTISNTRVANIFQTTYSYREDS